MLIYLFKWTSRQLVKFVKPLFYKGLINEIIKENYVSKIYLENKKLKKENFKKIYFITDKTKELEEIINQNPLFIKINLPQW